MQLPELTLDDKVAILEMLLPFAMAGRMPHTAEINQLVPPDDPGNPSTIKPAPLHRSPSQTRARAQSLVQRPQERDELRDGEWSTRQRAIDCRPLFAWRRQRADQPVRAVVTGHRLHHDLGLVPLFAQIMSVPNGGRNCVPLGQERT